MRDSSIDIEPVPVNFGAPNKGTSTSLVERLAAGILTPGINVLEGPPGSGRAALVHRLPQVLAKLALSPRCPERFREYRCLLLLWLRGGSAHSVKRSEASLVSVIYPDQRPVIDWGPPRGRLRHILGIDPSTELLGFAEKAEYWPEFVCGLAIPKLHFVGIMEWNEWLKQAELMSSSTEELIGSYAASALFLTDSSVCLDQWLGPIAASDGGKIYQKAGPQPSEWSSRSRSQDVGGELDEQSSSSGRTSRAHVFHMLLPDKTEVLAEMRAALVAVGTRHGFSDVESALLEEIMVAFGRFPAFYREFLKLIESFDIDKLRGYVSQRQLSKRLAAWLARIAQTERIRFLFDRAYKSLEDGEKVAIGIVALSRISSRSVGELRRGVQGDDRWVNAAANPQWKSSCKRLVEYHLLLEIESPIDGNSQSDLGAIADSSVKISHAFAWFVAKQNPAREMAKSLAIDTCPSGSFSQRRFLWCWVVSGTAYCIFFVLDKIVLEVLGGSAAGIRVDSESLWLSFWRTGVITKICPFVAVVLPLLYLVGFPLRKLWIKARARWLRWKSRISIRRRMIS